MESPVVEGWVWVWLGGQASCDARVAEHNISAAATKSPRRTLDMAHAMGYDEDMLIENISIVSEALGFSL